MASYTSSPSRSTGGASIRRISVSDPSTSTYSSSLSKIQSALTSQRRSQAQLDFETQSQTDPIGARENYIKFLQSELSTMMPGSADYNRMAISISNQVESLNSAIDANNLALLEYKAETGAVLPEDKIAYYQQALQNTKEGTTDYYRLMNKIENEKDKAALSQKGKEDYLYDYGYLSKDEYRKILETRVTNAQNNQEYQAAANALASFQKTTRVKESDSKIAEAKQRQSAGIGGDKVALALATYETLAEEYNKETDPTRKESLHGQVIAAQNSYYSTYFASEEIKIRQGIKQGTYTDQDLINLKMKQYQTASTEEDAMKAWLEIQSIVESEAKKQVSTNTQSVRSMLADLNQKLSQAKKDQDYQGVYEAHAAMQALYDKAKTIVPADDYGFWNGYENFMTSLDDPKNDFNANKVAASLKNPDSYGILYNPETGEKERRVDFKRDVSGGWTVDGSNMIAYGSTNKGQHTLRELQDLNVDALIDQINSQYKVQIPKPKDLGITKTFGTNFTLDAKAGKATPGAQYDPISKQYYLLNSDNLQDAMVKLKGYRDANKFLGMNIYENVPVYDDKGQFVRTEKKLNPVINTLANVQTSILGQNSTNFQNQAKNALVSVATMASPLAGLTTNFALNGGKLGLTQDFGIKMPTTQSLMNNVFNALPGGAVTNLASSAIDAITPGNFNPIDTGLNWAESEAQKLIADIGNTLNNIKPIDLSQVSMPKVDLNSIVNSVKNIQFKAPDINLPKVDIGGTINHVANDFGNTVNNVWNDVKNTATNTWNSVKNWLHF